MSDAGREPLRLLVFSASLRAQSLVRTASDADVPLIELLQSTYEAAATSADWDRAALERPNGGPTDA